MIIDGNKISESILSELRQTKPPKKELAAILVGEDEASLSFLRQKKKTATSLGVKFVLYHLSQDLSQEELEKEVKKISKRRSVGGVIVQLPLPKKHNRIPVLNAIGIEKDVDVLNGETTSVLAPATGALKRILEEVGFDLPGKRAVVVGPGLLIGQPIATWLMTRVIKLSVLGKAKLDTEVLKEADLIVSGTGQAHLIKGEYIKKGAVVIDYGYGSVNGKLAGDIEIDSVDKVASYVTPTPGGTGPVVVAMLLWNFFQMNK